jgi:hypothetical protein
MAAAVQSVVRTVADRVLPVAAHTSAARTSPVICRQYHTALVAKAACNLRNSFVPFTSNTRSAARRVTCMAASQVHSPPGFHETLSAAHSSLQLPSCIMLAYLVLGCLQPFTIVGSGRVGKALADLGAGDDVRYCVLNSGVYEREATVLAG